MVFVRARPMSQPSEVVTAYTANRWRLVSTGAPASKDSPPPSPVVKGQKLTVSATCYCLGGSTASGLPVGPGIMATDPSVIPLGTRAYVPGYGNAVAADTGGAVKGLTIDLWVSSCKKAAAYGRQTLTITIL